MVAVKYDTSCSICDSHLQSVELQELLNVCKYYVLPASQVSWQFSNVVHCRHVLLCEKGVCVCGVWVVCVCVLESGRVCVYGERERSN